MSSIPDASTPRRSVLTLILATGVCFIVGGLLFWRLHRPNAASPTPAAAEVDSTEMVPAPRPEDELPQLVQQPREAVPPAGRTGVPTLPQRQPGANAAVTAAPVRAEPSPAARQLMNNLFQLDQAQFPQTAEQLAVWKTNLQQLVQQGAGAVPAIQEFLDKNVDLGFGKEGSQLLGYNSARAALFDALVQIGGPEAISALSQTLQTTADPREIAMLARGLDQLEPQQHQQEVLDAARQVLAMAAGGKADEMDVGPLFDVMQRYGGAAAVADLQEATRHWSYYSAIALAQLPEGAGVPALIQMVQDTSGKNKGVAALEALTQIAAQYPEARSALLDEVRSNKINPGLWPYLASALAGDQLQFRDAFSDAITPAGARDVKTFHITSGNQNFYSAPSAVMTPDQINQQMALIDELLANTSNPIGIQTLQNAKASLARRLPQPSSGAGI